MDTVSVGGTELHVATDEAERGSKAPFFALYRDSERRRRYGYLCANCETADNAVDPMGTIQCNACGNRRKPEEWDAAHE
jgi:hypothetical protein